MSSPLIVILDEETIKLSASNIKALRIIRDDPGIRPREFAKAMWPDSPGWKRSSRSGPKGSHKGGGMYLAGGGYMGKLYRRGLIRNTYAYRFDTGYVLTPLGRQAIQAVEKRGDV